MPTLDSSVMIGCCNLKKPLNTKQVLLLLVQPSANLSNCSFILWKA